MATELKGGFVTKDLKAVTDMTAKNQFTRDAFEEML
jgi:hypothetical protein